MFLNGDGIPDKDVRGERVVDDSFLLCFNAHHEDLEFQTPDGLFAQEWTVVLDTTTATGERTGATAVVVAGTATTVRARSVLVLRKSA